MITREQLLEAIVEAVVWGKKGPIVVRGDWDVRDSIKKSKKYTHPSYTKLKRQMRGLTTKEKEMFKRGIRLARKAR